MNFGEIKTRAADYLRETDLSTQIPDLVKLAQRKLERDNWKCMEARAATSSTEAFISIPTRFKEARWFNVIDGNVYYRLEKTSAQHALSSYPDLTNNTGRPALFATMTNTSEFLVRPTPDKSYTFDLYYYQYLPELALDADTNWWTTNAWELLVYGSLIEAEAFVANDARIPLWKALYDDAFNRLKRAEISEEFAGSPQYVRNVF